MTDHMGNMTLKKLCTRHSVIRINVLYITTWSLATAYKLDRSWPRVCSRGSGEVDYSYPHYSKTSEDHRQPPHLPLALPTIPTQTPHHHHVPHRPLLLRLWPPMVRARDSLWQRQELQQLLHLQHELHSQRLGKPYLHRARQ